jgi:hypothetical protein
MLTAEDAAQVRHQSECDVNPVKIVIGFVPFVLFTVLAGWIPVGWAAVIGLVAALGVIAVTVRGGLNILPVVQAVILLVIALVGFIGGAGVDAFLAVFGRGIASLALGLFIVVTATAMPFTARFARAAAPPETWHSPKFLQVNRRLSLAWGAVVLALGVCHLVDAILEAHGAGPLARLLVDWVVPILAFVRVIAYTRRIVAEHTSTGTVQEGQNP